MELRKFYQKVRQIESQILEAAVIVASVETADGGAAGILTEVLREQAARLVAEGRARLASKEESEAYRCRVCEGVQAAEQAAQANRLQIAVLADEELRTVRSLSRQKK